jgi:hypothetical protein
MKTYAGVDAQIHVFFISVLVRGVVSFTLWSFYTRYPLDGRLAVPPELVWTTGSWHIGKLALKGGP